MYVQHNKLALRIVLVVLAIAVVGFYFYGTFYASWWGKGKTDNSTDRGNRLNIPYSISGRPVVVGEVVEYFGNEIRKDITGDGLEDVVFLITEQPGGSGTFYYVVAAIADGSGGYTGSQAMLLGDRIAPQTTESGPGKTIIVNYADRLPTDSFTTPPHVGKSLRLLYDQATMQFGEVVVDFEGEANPSVMKLDMKKWILVEALFNDGRTFVPKRPGVFTLSLMPTGTFSATTDCNGVGGSYTTSNDPDKRIQFTDMVSTLMYCENSQEAEFVQLLQNTSSYHFTSRGELILDLKFDSGSVVFR
jgi:hypothetical protein